MSRLGSTYRPPQYSAPPEPESEMDFGMLGNVLSGAGNLIDLPGSMVRDAASFSNPFDQIMTPFSSDNRTSGAEISRYWMGGDEDSGGNQLAGMLIDILSDPLMIASGGTLAAGKMGAKAAGSAIKGAKGVGKAAKSGYDASKAGSRSSQATAKAAKSAQRSYDEADRLSRNSGNLRAQLEGRDMSADLGPMPPRNPNLAYGPEYSWNPDFVGPPTGQVSREALIAGRPREVSDAATLVQALDGFSDAARNSGAMRQARVQSLAQNPMLRATEGAQALGAGAQAGARQLGRSMYGGVAGGMGGMARGARDIAGRAMMGDRNAMMQAGAFAGNAANTMGGLHRSQEPSIEDMIAQAIMEDPELGAQLVELLGAGQY